MLQPEASAVPEPRRDLRVSDTEWMLLLYPWWPHHPNWWLELRFLEDRADGIKNPPVAVRFMRDWAEIAAHLAAHRALARQRADQVRQSGNGPRPAGLFWGVQPRVTRRAGREHVAAFVALTCSLESNDWGAWPAQQRPRVMWEALHGCPRPPSVVTWTGHGFDAWWLLREPLWDRRRGEQAQNAVARSLHADRPQDAAGFCRWPNTLNYMGFPGERPRSVRVVWWQPQIRYAFPTLLEGFLPYAAPPRRSAQNCPSAAWKYFQNLLREDEKLEALWTRDYGTCTASDRRTLNLALADLLVGHELAEFDYETLAPLAPWNAVCAPAPAELARVWQEVQGKDTVSASPAVSPLALVVESVALPGLLLEALPESAWTEWARLYRMAVGACTEAPDEFHYLALLTVLGTAFGRSVVLHCGRPLYLNVYSILVGPTGDRKSTAAHLALDLLARVAPEALLMTGGGSQEGLMERMAGISDGEHRTLWFVDEMASLLKKARRESSGSLIEFVTELFHCPDFMTHSTRSKAIHLQHPTLSILAGSTPTWLEAALQQEDILGGFVNRFVYATGQPKPHNPMPARPDKKALDELAAWMRRATQAPDRELRLAPETHALWCGFYVDWRRSIDACGEHVAALLRRIDLYILKFAGMAAAMDDASEVSPDHLRVGVDLGRFLAGCAYRLLGNLGASNDCRLETLIEQKLLEADGPVRRKQLRQALGGRISGEKLDRVLTAMERNGLIRQSTDTTARNASRLVQLT